MTAALRFYLAGPMTGYPLQNFPAFADATAWLRTQGHVVLSPAEMDLDLGFDPAIPLEDQGFDWTETMERDLEALMTAQAVAFLPGSRRSTGALAEYEVARALGLRVFALAAPAPFTLTEASYELMDQWLLGACPSHLADWAAA